jgi:hypothetical protein
MSRSAKLFTKDRGQAVRLPRKPENWDGFFAERGLPEQTPSMKA